jgi:uncharacterized protein YcbK (DUF882 family)
MAQRLVSRRGFLVGAIATPFIAKPALADISGGFCPPGGGGWGTTGPGSAGGSGVYTNSDIVNADIPSLTGNREVYFRHARTGERIGGQYLADGQYIPEFLENFNRFARDDHNGEQAQMSAGLLDIVSRIAEMLGTGTEPFQVNSAFRSRATNASLVSSGAAKNSLHMQGKALDISHPHKSPSSVYACGMKLAVGGVGRYPSFTHVDTGNHRTWGTGR